MNYQQLMLRIRKGLYWLKKYIEKDGLPHYDAMLNYSYYKNAASKLGISYKELGDVLEFSLNGVRRRISGWSVDLDSVATTVVAGDKPLCSRMLKDNGLPVPDFFEIPNLNLKEALDKASLLSDKIVIKPARGTAEARGVTAGIDKNDKRAIKKAFWKAAIHSNTVMMETYVEGDRYRFLVCKNTLLSVSAESKPFVIGDGQSTLEELVEKENAKRLSNIALLPEINHPLLFPIVPNYDVSKSHGVNPQDTVPKDKKVICHDLIDMSVGCAPQDVTESAHPELTELAIKAAEVLGVNLGGVDIFCKDITVPSEESEAKIIEINTTPGLRPHYEIINQEDSRDVALGILKKMFEM